MTIGVFGRRYATALLSLATEASNVDKVTEDLTGFVAAWDDSRELRAAFENPVVSAEARRNILREIAETSGMDPLVRNTLLLISDRGRMRYVPEILEAFRSLSEQRGGRVRAEVVSAVELPEAYFSELQKTLERVTGKQVTVSKRVDASLLGGVVTRVGDRVFDGSIKNRLEELKHELSR